MILCSCKLYWILGKLKRFFSYLEMESAIWILVYNNSINKVLNQYTLLFLVLHLYYLFIFKVLQFGWYTVKSTKPNFISESCVSRMGIIKDREFQYCHSVNELSSFIFSFCILFFCESILKCHHFCVSPINNFKCFNNEWKSQIRTFYRKYLFPTTVSYVNL